MMLPSKSSPSSLSSSSLSTLMSSSSRSLSVICSNTSRFWFRSTCIACLVACTLIASASCSSFVRRVLANSRFYELWRKTWLEGSICTQGGQLTMPALLRSYSLVRNLRSRSASAWRILCCKRVNRRVRSVSESVLEALLRGVTGPCVSRAICVLYHAVTIANRE